LDRFQESQGKIASAKAKSDHRDLGKPRQNGSAKAKLGVSNADGHLSVANTAKREEEKLKVAVNNAAVAKSERERKLQTKPNSQAQQSRTIK
jgi:hypothetical protein